MPLITLRNNRADNTITLRSEDIFYIERNHHAWPAYTAIRVSPVGMVYEVCETPGEIQALIHEANRRAQCAAQVPETLANIAEWFKRAIPNPDAKSRSVQLGCHFEEVAEMAEAIHDIDLAARIGGVADFYKSEARIDNADVGRKALLDALCDQIVTAIGVGHMFGFDILGALAEVNRSNWSKFDENGNPLFNEQGKIAKGPNYTAPKLDEFL